MLEIEQSGGVRRAARVLVVDDDPALRAMLLEFLANNSLQGQGAATQAEVLRCLREAPDAIVLDLNLGSEDGLEILKVIRSESDVPVIITTGHRQDEIDRVLGLELGADDYVLKPYSLRELLARIRAVTRRRGEAVDPVRQRRRAKIRFNGWELDRNTQKLSREGVEPVALTKGEYALLQAFLDAPGRSLSREHLLRATRIHEDIFDRSIDVQILRLRRKLERDETSPRLIETLRGVGYVFKGGVDP
ncbi:response regulator [Caulobacter segnis]|uniref:response regulator n=1 Tax=Caulobacter segnis TaxID=88688 RepID=UPI00240F63EE|nr:response regulator [Caulobacter segnis]MDG2520455.1 response regulator [Caulobacter segnis]